MPVHDTRTRTATSRARLRQHVSRQCAPRKKDCPVRPPPSPPRVRLLRCPRLPLRHPRPPLLSLRRSSRWFALHDPPLAGPGLLPNPPPHKPSTQLTRLGLPHPQMAPPLPLLPPPPPSLGPRPPPRRPCRLHLCLHLLPHPHQNTPSPPLHHPRRRLRRLPPPLPPIPQPPRLHPSPARPPLHHRHPHLPPPLFPLVAPPPPRPRPGRRRRAVPPPFTRGCHRRPTSLGQVGHLPPRVPPPRREAESQFRRGKGAVAAGERRPGREGVTLRLLSV